MLQYRFLFFFYLDSMSFNSGIHIFTVKLLTSMLLNRTIMSCFIEWSVCSLPLTNNHLYSFTSGGLYNDFLILMMISMNSLMVCLCTLFLLILRWLHCFFNDHEFPLKCGLCNAVEWTRILPLFKDCELPLWDGEFPTKDQVSNCRTMTVNLPLHLCLLDSIFNDWHLPSQGLLLRILLTSQWIRLGAFQPYWAMNFYFLITSTFTHAWVASMDNDSFYCRLLQREFFRQW
jgi:hypothetical protein